VTTRRPFQRFDLLLGAVTPTTAFKLGEKSDDPVAMYHADICILARTPGRSIPALSVPYGFDARRGLPIGVQLTAAPFQGRGFFSGRLICLEQTARPGTLALRRFYRLSSVAEEV
jgi:Asp-tRNA(Asn)/Glu-tRNA(Gln) amidotransferase A subunit family amidase